VCGWRLNAGVRTDGGLRRLTAAYGRRQFRYLLSAKLRNERRMAKKAKEAERLRQAEEKERKRRLQMAVAAARTKPQAADAKGKKDPSVQQTTAAAPFSPFSSAWPRQPMDEVGSLAEAAAAAVMDSSLEAKKKADGEAATRKETEAAELEEAKAALKDQTMIDAMIMDDKRTAPRLPPLIRASY